jgi:hypothetical protein
MWNPVVLVASNMFLPRDEFVAFAKANQEKYKVDLTEPNTPTVGNFFVDALINDFKVAYRDLCERTYQEQIAAFKAGNLCLSDFGPRG